MEYEVKGKEIRLELIEWKDHCSLQGVGWSDVNDVIDLTPALISSIGWVLHETEEYLCVAAHMSESSFVDGDMLIMKNCIKSRKIIPYGNDVEYEDGSK